MRLLFWTFLPDEALVLVIMAAGFALMLGFRRAAAGLLGTVVLFALLGPIIEGLVAGRSPGWQFLIIVLVGLVLLRAVILLLLGRQTASHLAALLLHDLILLPFRTVGWRFRRGR
jgi:hypothetical protein